MGCLAQLVPTGGPGGAVEIEIQWSRIHIVEKAEDLPGEIKEQAPREAKGRLGRIQGVYHRRQVCLVAEHIAVAEEAQRVLLHEVRGHLGMRAVFGKDFDAFLDEIIAA